MSPEKNKNVIRSLFQVLVNEKDIEKADIFYHPNFVDHQLAPGQPPGPAGIKMAVHRYLQAFPDLHVSIDAMVAEENKVTTLETWTGTHLGEIDGFAPSKDSFHAQRMHLFILQEEKVMEEWAIGNVLHQMGLFP